MELHERLRLARKAAGYDTAKDAAEALGVQYPTYAGHENGSSGFPADAAEHYARKFKVRFEWLMIGVGPMADLFSKHQELLADFDSLPPEIQESYAKILKQIAEPYKVQPPEEEHPQGGAKSA